MCEGERKTERKTPGVESRERGERVTEGRNTALAQLCGTFDMSFEPLLIT